MYDMKKKKMMASGGMIKNPMKEEGADIDEKTTNFLNAPAKQYADGGYAKGGKVKRDPYAEGVNADFLNYAQNEAFKERMKEKKQKEFEKIKKDLSMRGATAGTEEDVERLNYAEGGEVRKPSAVMAIVAKLKKKPEGEMPMGAEEEGPEGEMNAHEEGYKVAAEEMMSAMKSGDASAFAESLKNFVQMCGMSED